MIEAVHGFWLRCRDLLQRRRLEAELAEEMRQHVELRAAAERAAGMPAEEAGRTARLQFGQLERLKEECRDEWGFARLESLVQDIGYAGRALARAPGFVLGVAGSLAVAIGAGAALVGVALQVLRPVLPFADPSTLLVVQPYDTRANAPGLMSAAQFNRLAAGAAVFRQFAAQHPDQMNLIVNDRPSAVSVAWVTPGFFEAFGVRPALGRTFAPDEHRTTGRGGVAVLTHGTWMAEFGGDPDVLGRTVRLGGELRRIVGVMPESFRSPIGFPGWGVFLPSTGDALARGEWWRTLVWVVGRLQPGESATRAQAELAVIAPPPGLPPEATAGVVMRVVPVRELYRSDRDEVIAVLFAAGLFLYAMACASAFNLVLMRAARRRTELGLRAALGGSRGRIGQLLVVENLLLVGVAGLAAGMLALRFGSLLVRSLHYWWPSAGPLSVQTGTLMLLVAVAVLGAIVAVGLVPVVRTLRYAGRDETDRGRGALVDRRPLGCWRSASTVAQAALAVVLLVGAALCGKTLVRLMQSGVGFDPARRVAVVGQRPPLAFTYPPPTDEYLLLAERLQAEFAQLPGVERCALASRDPLSGRRETVSVRLEGRPDSAEIPCLLNRVSSGYFATLDLPLVQGRGFDGMARGDPGVVVISEGMARRCFPGENPLGRRLDVGPRGQWHMLDANRAAERETWEIVGVVRDVRDGGSRGEPPPQCYAPFWQRNPYDVQSLTVILRSQGAASAGFAAAVRRATFGVDPNLVITDVVSLEERADLSIHLERCASVTLGAVAGFALVLAGIGVFSVLGAVVAEQQREYGVRLALGAPPGAVQWLVLRRGLGWTALGIAIGLGAAWGLARSIQVLLYATSLHDPVVFGAAGLFVFVVAGFACWLPARRAAGLDPMITLRAG